MYLTLIHIFFDENSDTNPLHYYIEDQETDSSNINKSIKPSANNKKWTYQRQQAAKLFKEVKLDTAEDVAKFQTEHGLTVDGMLGSKTLDKLNEIYETNISINQIKYPQVTQVKTKQATPQPSAKVTSQSSAKITPKVNNPSRATSYQKALLLTAQNKKDTETDLRKLANKYGKELSAWKGTPSYISFYNNLAKEDTKKVETVIKSIVTAPVDPVSSVMDVADVISEDVNGISVSDMINNTTRGDLALLATFLTSPKKAVTKLMQKMVRSSKPNKPRKAVLVNKPKPKPKPKIHPNEHVDVVIERFNTAQQKARKATKNKQNISANMRKAQQTEREKLAKLYKARGYKRLDVNEVKKQYNLDFGSENYPYAYITKDNKIVIFNKGGLISKNKRFKI